MKGARGGLALAALVGLAGGCKSGSEPPPRAAIVDAAVAPRPRPAELVHVTLKVLGMT